ncbi:pirin family protein [Mycolicibacterium arenosum]|uniref:Pirin family protein n=1 Tax=Mycolicibacterium arenosum TaxID=2952157 RepID=A0ABT1M8X7_9MYCO|nr:pirin family protein [Mycolicibacterium sp. CAU 1645]MCP9274847.1 pirin family protein [Mycolicibacterium sp. CAU 1645]
MSNVEPGPDEVACGASSFAGVLHPRDVPLGGPRALRVRRTLPQRERSLIGAWCFVDHYGPDDVGAGPGMDVPPHPHTGLQTVSWLFRGEIEHRDSAGVHAVVRPGELNLMTAGAGICHSEVSLPDTTVLHGVQLWVALPDAHRDTARDFHHFAPPARDHDGVDVRVFLGTLAGATSPVPTFTPLLGAQVDIAPGGTASFEVSPDFEHGVLLDAGAVSAGGTALARGDLWYQSPGHRRLALVNTGAEPARLLVLGGPPFGEELVMWWNFVGRSHSDIVEYRRRWQDHDARFGSVVGYPGNRLSAPPLPNGALRPRGNPPTRRPDDRPADR